MALPKLQDVLDTMNWQDSFYDLYPGYSKPVEPDEECLYESKEYALSDARDLLRMLKGFPDPIPVYRVVHIKGLEKLKRDNPGWCWSWDQDSAVEFAKIHGLPKPWALLRGKAPKSQVHWMETLRLYHQYSGTDGADSENEIRIPGNYIKDLKAKMLK
jgi:hypothetical protein